MAKINLYFKSVFVFFNVLFAVLGIAVLALGVLAHVLIDEIEGNLKAVLVLYTTGAVTFFISVLGAYGAQKESKCALITFFTFMSSGTIILFLLAVPLAISRPQFFVAVQNGLNQLVPLDQSREEVQHTAMVMQKEFRCCGLFNDYQDWGREVPQSCDCSPLNGESDDQCQQMPSEYRMILDRRSSKRMVYKTPCGPILMDYLQKFFSGVLGVVFTLAALALLGAVMSLAMIISVSASTSSLLPMVALTYQPPKYSELEPCVKQ